MIGTWRLFLTRGQINTHTRTKLYWHIYTKCCISVGLTKFETNKHNTYYYCYLLFGDERIFIWPTKVRWQWEWLRPQQSAALLLQTDARMKNTVGVRSTTSASLPQKDIAGLTFGLWWTHKIVPNDTIMYQIGVVVAAAVVWAVCRVSSISHVWSNKHEIQYMRARDDCAFSHIQWKSFLLHSAVYSICIIRKCQAVMCLYLRSTVMTTAFRIGSGDIDRTSDYTALRQHGIEHFIEKGAEFESYLPWISNFRFVSIFFCDNPFMTYHRVAHNLSPSKTKPEVLVFKSQASIDFAIFFFARLRFFFFLIRLMSIHVDGHIGNIPNIFYARKR